MVLQIGGEAVVLTERAAHSLGSELQKAAGEASVEYERAVSQSGSEAL